MSGAHSNSPTIQPSYTGLQLQTSTNALPIPIVYGINIIAPNIIWNGDFSAIPQYSHSSGGKGGGGSNPQVSGYIYQTAIIMALCEGPISTIGTVWKGQSTYSLSTMNPPASAIVAVAESSGLKPASMSLYSGTVPQAVWSYLSSAHADQAVNYPGLAYLAAPDYNLGSSGTLDVTNVEIYGVLYTSAVINAHDADPAFVIQDLLTNAQYGVGFPAASIDATTLLGGSGGASYQCYCQAAGLALSPALTNQEAAHSILARWLQLTNSAAVWSGGKLKIIPYGDTSITGSLSSGASCIFNPNITPVYDLSDDDFVHTDGEDPLKVTRTDPYAAYNIQPVEILDRGNAYAPTPITVFDQNAIDLYGMRIASTVSAHEICDPKIGAISAQLILQRGLYVRNSYSFTLSWEYCLLEPMDLVTITDAGLGLSKTPVRIIEIEEAESGLLTVIAEEFSGGTATAAVYPVQTASGNSLNRNVVPASINPPLIFEPPAALAKSGKAEVWIGLSGGNGGVVDPNWGGAVIWISRDNATYTAIGTVTAPARQGVLTAALPSVAGQVSTAPPFLNMDMANTLAVDMSESNGVLNSAVTEDAENGITLCLVDNELLAYTTATLTATSQYALTGLARGLYGAEPTAHASGAAFIRIDNAIFKYALPSVYIGSGFYLKFQSFNVFGQAVQALADCMAYNYTPIGSSAMGPVAQALAAGTNIDCGIASSVASEYDDFGFASDPYPYGIDLGLASS